MTRELLRRRNVRAGVHVRSQKKLGRPDAMGNKKGRPEEPHALSFAVMPQKHACIGCDRGY
jgi:hypothetical protein